MTPTNRKGSRFGHDTVVDGMLKDGLWDAYHDYAMGSCAELCAQQHNVPREEQVLHKAILLKTIMCWLLIAQHS